MPYAFCFDEIIQYPIYTIIYMNTLGALVYKYVFAIISATYRTPNIVQLLFILCQFIVYLTMTISMQYIPLIFYKRICMWKINISKSIDFEFREFMWNWLGLTCVRWHTYKWLPNQIIHIVLI